ncbi:MAG: secretin and TonB N-terminal domain-containing protein [Muribaculaceae bacterium]|nr:secretin and TonB N-terminal domain-containing protein [Muribaculaceae bacterium]
MKQIFLTLILLIVSVASISAQKVTLRANDAPAADVFRELMIQTGKNFVYSTDVLKDVKVTVNAKNESLNKVLKRMFKGTDILWKIKDNSVVLMKSKSIKPIEKVVPTSSIEEAYGKPMILEEVLVTSEAEPMNPLTVKIGANNLTRDNLLHTPSILGVPDVIKTLQWEPGVAEGNSLLSGLHVHGGENDQNLYLLDGVPLYHTNHALGAFSTINADVVKSTDFYKSAIPARYDGRLSSVIDVSTKDGNPEKHHGSLSVALTTVSSFNINGPIGKKTTYSAALRLPWYMIITEPIFSLLDKNVQGYFSLIDANFKLRHTFNDRITGTLSLYFGDDRMKTKNKENLGNDVTDLERYDLRWGSFIVKAGVTQQVKRNLTGEYSLAYNGYFAKMKDFYSTTEIGSKGGPTDYSATNTAVNSGINDIIGRADFNYKRNETSELNFGANLTLHFFNKLRADRLSQTNDVMIKTRDISPGNTGTELSAYVEENRRLMDDRLLVNAGLNVSGYLNDGKIKGSLSPRLSATYRLTDGWSLSGAYARTVQYVHKLAENDMFLPTDQWIPVSGRFKPQTADKLTAGAGYEWGEGKWNASAEAYWKLMHNLIDFRDEYYLHPNWGEWNDRLTQGSGSAKGIDLKVERKVGKLTGFLSYSLGWADRKFRDSNGGVRFPARFDNRHTVKFLIDWRVSRKVSFNIGWTGRSGNRFTLLPQMWEAPDFPSLSGNEVPLKAPLNNHRLPFYHHMDLGMTIKTRRGMWNIGVYNVYANMNTVAIKRGYRSDILESGGGNGWLGSYSSPKFLKVKLLPIIPSVSYTWNF